MECNNYYVKRESIEQYEAEGEDEYIVSLQDNYDIEEQGYKIASVNLDNSIDQKQNINNEENSQNPDNKTNLKTTEDNYNKSNFKTDSNQITPIKNSTSIPSFEKSLTKSQTLATISPIKEKIMSAREPNKNMEFDKRSVGSAGSFELTFTEKELENLKDKINQKISSLGNYHIFCLNNVNIILKIYKEFTEILFKKILATLDQNKIFVKYFHDIIESYKKFCNELEKSNFNIKKMNNLTKDQDQLLSDNITNLIVNTQNTIKQNFEGFSKTLDETLISNGPLSKIKNIINKFENIKKMILNDIKFLETKKEKLEKKFNEKSVPIFTNYKKFENKINNEDENSMKNLLKLIEGNDFFLIEIEITLRINKLFNKISISLKNYTKSIGELKDCVIEYASLIKETVEKFLNENKKIYGGNMNIDFEHMQKFYESITKETLEKSFIVSRVLGSDNLINKFNEYFNEYRNDLLKFKIVKSDLISKQEKFNVSEFHSIEDMINLIINLIPVERKLSSSFLVGKYDLKRDPGMFQSWKNCIVLRTLQNNFLVYDDIINKRPLEIFNIKRLRIRNKDAKFPFKFEISEKKKGMIFDSTKVFNFDAINQKTYESIKSAIDNITGK
jgi:hypothetical protein